MSQEMDSANGSKSNATDENLREEKTFQLKTPDPPKRGSRRGGGRPPGRKSFRKRLKREKRDRIKYKLNKLPPSETSDEVSLPAFNPAAEFNEIVEDKLPVTGPRPQHNQLNSEHLMSNSAEVVTTAVDFHDDALPSRHVTAEVSSNEEIVQTAGDTKSFEQIAAPVHEFSEKLEPSLHELMTEVRLKVDMFLYYRWYVIVKRNAVHVTMISAQDNFRLQRNVTFHPSGKVELFVHNETVNLCVILKKCPPSVPLTHATIGKFVDRIVKIVDEIRKFEACSGCDNPSDKPGWSTCPLGEIDKNPFSECRYDETFRSFSCKRLVKRSAWRCSECKKLLNSLKRRANFARVENPHPNTPNINLTEAQKLNKLSEQQRELDNARKVIGRLRKKIEHLMEKESIEIDRDLSDDLTDVLNSNELTPAQSVFLQEQIKASQRSKTGMRWHPTMIRLALSIHITSPAAYEMMRDTGMIKLPSSRTLFDYARVKPVHDGIDEVVLESLEQKANKFKHEYQKYHVLMADEMYISQNLVFQKSTGKMVGYTNLNDVDKEVKKLESFLNNEDESMNEPALAQKILVYLVKGVSSGIKEVIATYPVASLSVDQMFVGTWQVIRVLETHGIAVIALVSDGFSMNRAFIKRHIPVTILPNGLIFDTVNLAAPHRVLYFLSDVPHLLKTIRNCLLNSRSDGKRSRRNMEKNGKRISWDFIIKLYEAHKKKSFRKSFKLNPMNVYPDSYARMKVKYAAEICSRTVAQDLEDQEWEEASELINFLRKVNDWFDCLNGAHSSVSKKKRNANLASYESTEDNRFDTLLEFLDYLEDWKADAREAAKVQQTTTNNVSVTTRVGENGADKTGDGTVCASEEGMDSSENESAISKKLLTKQTLEGIEISTRAFIPMVKFLLKEGTKFINARVFTQDPIEQHFSKLRAGQGGSNNPNLGQALNRNRALHTIGKLGMKRRRGNVAQESCHVEVTEEPLPKRKPSREPKIAADFC